MSVLALRQIVSRKPAGRFDPERLAAANINPVTGLATDYLNHFNEAIMMLEMVAAMPEAVDELLAWRPMTYCEHFAASKQTHRTLAIAAYATAQPKARRRLEEVATAMNAILVATRETLRLNGPQQVMAGLARDAATQLKPMVARAGSLINGREAGRAPPVDAAQTAVDALMDR
jgi:hypothetical protein